MLSDIDKWYRQLLFGDRAEIIDAYNTMLYRAGEVVRFNTPGGIISGRIIDVTPEGKIV